MYNICMDKYTQVKECNQAMHMAHLDGVRLVEAVPKGQWSIWGTGLSKSAIENIKEDGWQGDDQLGDILTQIMHELFDEPEWDTPRRTVSMGHTPPGTPPPEPSDFSDSNMDNLGYHSDDETSQEGEKNLDFAEGDSDTMHTPRGSIVDETQSGHLSDSAIVRPKVRPKGSTDRVTGGGGRGGRGGSRASKVNHRSLRDRSPKASSIKRPNTSSLQLST